MVGNDSKYFFVTLINTFRSIITMSSLTKDEDDLVFYVLCYDSIF